MIRAFIHEYLEDIKKLAESINGEALEKVIEILREAYRAKRRVFVFGNGGSAATANHFRCDFGKNAVKDREDRFRVISLSESPCAITAYGNDVAFESIFEEQLRNLMEEGDLVIAISASGNSPNVLSAVKYAREKKAKVVGLTGFAGGMLKELCDVNINVPSDSMEKIEDLHLVICHIIVYWFKNNQDWLKRG